MTSSILKQVFTLYRREIRAIRPNAEIVMVFDVASPHVTREVFMHLNRLNLHTLLVPAGMTWLLQPLDTHVFSTLKRSLHDRQTRGRAASPLGILPSCSWIRIAGEAVKEVLVDRDWTHSLRGNGLHAQVVPLRLTLVTFFDEVVPLLAEPLTSAQMKDLLNRPTMERRDACLRYSMRLLEGRAAVPAARVVPVSVSHFSLPTLYSLSFSLLSHYPYSLPPSHLSRSPPRFRDPIPSLVHPLRLSLPLAYTSHS